MSTLSNSESLQAVRIGVAHAISEAGLTPSQAEAKLAGFGLDDLIKIPQVAFTGALLGGSALGAYAGHVHHSADRAVSGEDDPEINTLRKKIDAYHKMTADLAQAEAAGRVI